MTNWNQSQYFAHKGDEIPLSHIIQQYDQSVDKKETSVSRNDDRFQHTIDLFHIDLDHIHTRCHYCLHSLEFNQHNDLSLLLFRNHLTSSLQSTFLSEIIEKKSNCIQMKCESGCNVYYCSEECRVQDRLVRGHNLICNHTHSNLSKEFYQYLSKSNHSILLILSLKVITKLLIRTIQRLSSMLLIEESNSKTLSRITEVLDDELTRFLKSYPITKTTITENGLKYDGKVQDIMEEENELVMDSYTLLKAMIIYEKLPMFLSDLSIYNQGQSQLLATTILSSSSSSSSMFSSVFVESIVEAFDKTMTTSLWKDILHRVRYYNVSMTLISPFIDLAKKLPMIPSTKLRHQIYNTFIQPMFPSNDNNNNDHSIPSIERNITRIASSAMDVMIPEIGPNPLLTKCATISFLHPVLPYLSHSCIPNIMMEAFNDRMMMMVMVGNNENRVGIRCIALRDIAIDEELTINYITSVEKFPMLHHRNLALGNRYMIPDRQEKNSVTDRKLNESSLDSTNPYFSILCSCVLCKYDRYSEMKDDDWKQCSESTKRFKTDNFQVQSIDQSSDQGIEKKNQSPSLSVVAIATTMRKSKRLMSQSTNIMDILSYSEIKQLSDYFMSQTQPESYTKAIDLLTSIQYDLGMQLLLSSSSSSSPSSSSSSKEEEAQERMNILNRAVKRIGDNDKRITNIEYWIADIFYALGVCHLNLNRWWIGHQIWLQSIYFLNSYYTKHDLLHDQIMKLKAYPHYRYLSSHSSSSIKIGNEQSNNIGMNMDMNMDIDRINLVLPSTNDRIGYEAIPWTKIHNITTEPLIFQSTIPWLSDSECDKIIQISESYALNHDGWTTTRHYAVPTTDLPIHIIPELNTLFSQRLVQRFATSLAYQFTEYHRSDVEYCDISVHDLFVVKYSQLYRDSLVDNLLSDIPSSDYNETKDSANISVPVDADATDAVPSQRYLPLHSDESTHSFVIALNSSEDYIGGGTYFIDLGKVLKSEKGHAVSFAGHLVHGGEPLFYGTRYIIAGFMLLHKQLIEIPSHETKSFFRFSFDVNE